MRTSVYVDGLNLYYGALKRTNYKWLNPVELARRLLLPECVVDRLLYFTAWVSGIPDEHAPIRQQTYLNALGTLPEVEVHFGSFLAKTVWRPLVNLPIAGRPISTTLPVVLPQGTHRVEGSGTLVVGTYPEHDSGKKRRPKVSTPLPDAVIAEFHTKEEKGSDVNLAAHLLNDAWNDLFDAAAVISNDTDLVTPIRMVTLERGKEVFVVCPGKRGAAPKLRKVASYVRHIRPKILMDSQFHDPIPNTKISKPAEW